MPSAKGGGTMAIDIDSLQIQIEATSSDAEKKIDSLTRRSKSLLASFFAFEDDGLNLLQFATASGYRLGHMVLRKSEGCRFVKHLVQREIQRKQQVFLSGRARQGGA